MCEKFLFERLKRTSSASFLLERAIKESLVARSNKKGICSLKGAAGNSLSGYLSAKRSWISIKGAAGGNSQRTLNKKKLSITKEAGWHRKVAEAYQLRFLQSCELAKEGQRLDFLVVPFRPLRELFIDDVVYRHDEVIQDTGKGVVG